MENWRVQTPEAFRHEIEETIVGKTVESIDLEADGDEHETLRTAHDKITIHLADGTKMEIVVRDGKMVVDAFR